jgi:hypothetical protein
MAGTVVMSNELGAFVDAEVKRAEADYQGARTRAISIVGLTSGLVTIITALLGVAEVQKLQALHGSPLWAMFAALIFFVLSTLCALLIHYPQSVTVAEVQDLREKVQQDWEKPAWDHRVAELQVDYLESLRSDNKRTGNLLFAAITGQLLGVVALSITAFLIIARLG